MMPQGAYYVHGAAPTTDDPYAAFADIFGHPPPPGRLPTSEDYPSSPISMNGSHPTYQHGDSSQLSFQVPPQPVFPGLANMGSQTSPGMHTASIGSRNGPTSRIVSGNGMLANAAVLNSNSPGSSRSNSTVSGSFAPSTTGSGSVAGSVSSETLSNASLPNSTASTYAPSTASASQPITSPGKVYSSPQSLPGSQSMPNVARRSTSTAAPASRTHTFDEATSRGPSGLTIANASTASMQALRNGGQSNSSGYPNGLSHSNSSNHGPNTAGGTSNMGTYSPQGMMTRSAVDLAGQRRQVSMGEDHSMSRSVSQVWSGLKKQVAMQRSASSTTVAARKPVTKGGRTIPTRSDLSAFSPGFGTAGSAGSSIPQGDGSGNVSSNSGPLGGGFGGPSGTLGGVNSPLTASHAASQGKGYHQGYHHNVMNPNGTNGSLLQNSALNGVNNGGNAGSSGSSVSGGVGTGHGPGHALGFGADDDWDRVPSRKSSTATINSLGGRSAIVSSIQREPLVYPALLSRVAQKYRERLAPVLGDRIKNELTYKNAFTGAEAVDVISYIIKTPDRNLALLLGRSLDAQKLFHDVTYDNRLRDSQAELYQFTTFDEQSNNVAEPNGVFTLLSECYSPTCSRNRLCYSISCPRRLEQQARLNMKLDPGLLGTSQQEASISLNEGEETEEKLWRFNVPPEVVEATPPTEQKRQEAIAELVLTERQFVKALEYLRESWIKPLRRSTVLGPEHRRDKFIRMVFLNVLEVHAVNLKFAEALTRRQQLAPVVNQIADVVLEFVPRFEPFVTYGAQQMYAKYEFEKERALNPAFARFVQQTEREPESHQLELNGYLTKPTTRLARYPLLLDAILKRTEKENPDHTNIPQAVAQIREFLFKVNAESGRAENRFSLHQLNQALTFRTGEYVDLHLLDPKRQLVFKGHLKKRPPPGEGNVQIYLFDNAILFAKRKKASGMSSMAAAAAAAAAAAVEPPTDDDSSSGREVLRVNSKPIPLQLLQMAEGDEIGRRKAAAHMIRTTVTRNTDDKVTFPITFQHLGRRGYEVTLYADNFQARKTWIELIVKQQEAQRAASNILTQHTLYSSTSSGSGRARCSASFEDGKRVLFGTDRGIYSAQMTYKDADGRFNPVSSALRLVLQSSAPVTQLDVLEKHGVVVMLSERTVSAFSLDLIDSNSDLSTRQKSVKTLASPVTLYKVDECLGRTLLTVVKSTNLSSTVRVLEPAGPPPSTSKRPPLRRLLTSGGGTAQQPDGFKVVKPPIDIPSATLSLSFLRSHLCLGCARGFELLDLESGKFESLLDPADTSLDFVIKRESLRPISLYRIGKEFLLNYSDFSFFINRNGWRSRPDWIIQWESSPQHIVLSYPYLVAFDHSLIEIRNMDTELVRVIQGESIRFLHESNHDILYAVENEKGQDEVVSLNFWEKQQQNTKNDRKDS